MKKLILLVCLLLISNFLQAEEIKLSCTMNRLKKYSSGESEKFNEKIIITITEFGKHRSIILDSDGYGSITSENYFKGGFSNDLSNSNKWYITSERLMPKGEEISTSINIDRNTGIVSYSNFYTSAKGYIIETSAKGECEKIDVMKKKF